MLSTVKNRAADLSRDAQVFCQSLVASVIVFAVVCWGGTPHWHHTGSCGANKLGKLLRKGSSVVGMRLDSVEGVRWVWEGSSYKQPLSSSLSQAEVAQEHVQPLTPATTSLKVLMWLFCAISHQTTTLQCPVPPISTDWNSKPYTTVYLSPNKLTTKILHMYTYTFTHVYAHTVNVFYLFIPIISYFISFTL